MRRPHHRNLTLFTGACLFAASTLVVCVSPAYPDTVSTPRERNITRVVAGLLRKYHVSQRPLDDQISRRAFTTMLDSLDPGKMYFLKSDVDEWAPLRTAIDDQVLGGDLSAGKAIFARFKTRVREAHAIARDLLASDFDFSVEESVLMDHEMRAFVSTKEERKDRWRRELKWKLLAMEADANHGGADVSSSEIPREEGTPRERLVRHYGRVETRIDQMSGDKVLEWILSAVATAYDPHTTYMSPHSNEEFMIHIRSNLEGVGAELREQGDYVYVTRVIEGGGASESGQVAVGDKVLEVAEGTDGDWVSAFQMSVTELAGLIRGRSGTLVRLKLAGKSGGERTALIERSRVEIKNEQASGHVLSIGGETTPLKAGYVRLPGFYQDGVARRRGDRDYQSCSRDVEKLLQSFTRQGVSAVILDLRGNGGGILEEAIRLTGLFIDRGPVVQVKSSDGALQEYEDEQSGAVWKGPLVVLTNKASASASEIVAGALQDYGRAIVVGDPQTHGKGTVQQSISLSDAVFRSTRNAPDYGNLKVTTQTYYLPNGRSTQKSGVAARIVLPSVVDKIATGEADLPNALSVDRVRALPHQSYEMCPDDLVEQLRIDSLARVSKSREFQELLGDIAIAVERRDRDWVPVERRRYMETWRRLFGDMEPVDPSSETKEAFPVDAYDHEVLEILKQYVNELASSGVDQHRGKS